MKVILLVTMFVLLLTISCKESTTESNGNNDEETFINILELSPDAGSVLTSQDTLSALLQFSIADEIQSDFGFSISIKFVSNIEGETFSMGSHSSITLGTKTGEVGLKYPLAQIWSHENLKHPLACYFYMHQMTSETASRVLAKTAEITYTE